MGTPLISGAMANKNARSYFGREAVSDPMPTRAGLDQRRGLLSDLRVSAVNLSPHNLFFGFLAIHYIMNQGWGNDPLGKGGDRGESI
jgi:hypothetical protein